MGRSRHVGWVAAGLVLGAGACYCIYKLTRGQRQGDRGLRLRPSRSAEDLTDGSYDDILNVDQLQKLLYLLESTDDPIIIERALVTLGNNAAFSANQVIIRELGGIPIIGSKINNPNHSIKEKALNALNNLSVNVENQVKIKVDSSFLSLYDGHVAKEILLRVLTLFQNINNCCKKEGCSAMQPTFPKGSLFFLLYGEECAQKMRALVDHHDADVKEKVTVLPKF
ncbi:armadillo repeat-containing protein 10 isoform X4 [Puma concolor]|uniref:Armadillo repeat-containing domain-containing protein n=3 Tax=Felidae TaxID=9681 RepID=A0ABI7XYD4_FELCA|nr:armadillo repeat-containing protein 10 isoform X4 [Puma concolor]